MQHLLSGWLLLPYELLYELLTSLGPKNFSIAQTLVSVLGALALDLAAILKDGCRLHTQILKTTLLIG